MREASQKSAIERNLQSIREKQYLDKCKKDGKVPRALYKKDVTEDKQINLKKVENLVNRLSVIKKSAGQESKEQDV